MLPIGIDLYDGLISSFNRNLKADSQRATNPHVVGQVDNERTMMLSDERCLVGRTIVDDKYREPLTMKVLDNFTDR
jgi:hypothetical protein